MDRSLTLHCKGCIISECIYLYLESAILMFYVSCHRSCGGQVSWDSTVAVGSTYPVDDETITHHVIDRPKVDKRQQFVSRTYVQPQWVMDSINARRLLPVEDYFPGAQMPPHLSPFVEEEEDDYIPRQREQQEEDDEEEMKEDSGEFG